MNESAVSQTAEYLNTRLQFGVPLATFQATKIAPPMPPSTPRPSG